MKKHSDSLQKTEFKIPDNYFDQFDQKMFERLNEVENNLQKKGKLIKFKPYKNLRSIAAILLLLFTVGYLIKYKAQQNINNDTIENMNYFDYNPWYSTLSNEIIHSFDEKDFQELEQNLQLNSKEVNDYILTNIDVEYYLNY